MRNDAEYYLKYRKNVETEMVALGDFLYRNTPDSNAAKEVSAPDSMRASYCVALLTTDETGCPANNAVEVEWS